MAKLTESALRQIIREELIKSLTEKQNLEEFNLKQIGQSIGKHFTSGMAQGTGGAVGKAFAGADALVRGQGTAQAKHNMQVKEISDKLSKVLDAISTLRGLPGYEELRKAFSDWTKKYPPGDYVGNQASRFGGGVGSQQKMVEK